MDVRRLEFFVRIAELGSLSRASLLLRIGQPALSRQMRLLEEEVGVSLFRRHRRGMQLTPEGQELLRRMSGPLRQLRSALQDVRELSKDVSGNVTVSIPASVSSNLAGPLTRLVRETAPGIGLRLIEGVAGNVISALDRGEIDIVLMHGPLSNWNGNTESLLHEDLLLAGPPDAHLSADAPVALASLAELPLILPEPEFLPEDLRSLLKRVRDLSGRELTLGPTANSFEHTKGNVRAGLGYAFLTASSFRLDAMGGTMTHAQFEPRVTRELIIVTHPHAQFPRAARKVKALIREAASEMIASGAWSATLS